MKVKILFALLILLVTTQMSHAYDTGLLSSGISSSCAISFKEFKCWGYNGNGENNVPSDLKNPWMVSVGPGFSCALGEEGVKCWGSNKYGQTDVPTNLKNPRTISTGLKSACALDDDGIKCWGVRTDDPPFKLKNPKMVTVGLNRICVLDDEGVRCWGVFNRLESKPSSYLKNAKMLSVGEDHACVLDDEGVKCWGSNRDGKSEVPSGLKNPRMVSAGRGHTCALDDEGVKCWGDYYHGETRVPSGLKNPRAVSAGDEFTCALDDEGIKCWGADSYHGTNVNGQISPPPLTFLRPQQNHPEFDLTTNVEFLEVISKGSTPVRGLLFAELAKFSKNKLVENRIPARFVLINLLAASIESGDSEYYLGTVIPAYQKSMEDIKKTTGILSMSNVPNSALVRITSLKVIQVSLSIISNFLSFSDREELKESNRLLGEAMANVDNLECIKATLGNLNTKKSLLNKLERSPKSFFLVTTLYSAVEFLDGLIK